MFCEKCIFHLQRVWVITTEAYEDIPQHKYLRIGINYHKPHNGVFYTTIDYFLGFAPYK